jgi:hypothetical protein
MKLRAARMASARIRRIDAVFLELDRVRIGIGNALDDFDCGDVDFTAAGRARFGLNFSGDDHARFLRQTLERGEGFGALLERHDALHHAGAVAKDRKEELAGLAQVVEPAANGDELADVRGGVLDVDDGRGFGCWLGHCFPG